MSANNNPIFLGGPNNQQSQAVTANTNRDGTGATATCWVTGSNGSLLGKIVITVPSASVADVIRLFWYDGTNYRLYDEIQVAAVSSPGVGTSVFRTEYVPSTPEVYPSGWKLMASTNQGQTTNILVLGGNY